MHYSMEPASSSNYAAREMGISDSEGCDAPRFSQHITEGLTGSLLFAPSPVKESLALPNDAAGSHTAAHPDVVDHVKQELTQNPSLRHTPPCNASRPPQTVPLSEQPTSSTPHSTAIPSFYNYNYSTTGQDVRSIVNFTSSTAPRTGSSSTPLETNVSSSHSYLPRNGLTHSSSNRPRTSTQKVFASSKDLIAHYGFPQILPPPPSTAPKSQDTTPQRSSEHLSDFESMKNSYLSMLASNPSNSSATTTTTTTTSALPPSNNVQSMSATDSDSLRAEDLENLVTMIMNSPELFDSREYLTSPMAPGMVDSFDSPLDDTPYNDFLNTPVLDGFSDDMLTSPNIYEGMSLFPELPTHTQPVVQEKVAPEPQGFDGLYTISPQESMLENFPATPATPSMGLYTSPRQPTSSLPTGPSSRNTSDASIKRKSNATGTRKGLTPDSLVPVDAPTQPRKYVIPSATSRKEVPAVFARKRARSMAFDEDDDELLEELAPDATEKQQIEWKRRQNTLAARRSRKRKLIHQQQLENTVSELEREAGMWKERALMLQGVLKAKGMDFEFKD